MTTSLMYQSVGLDTDMRVPQKIGQIRIFQWQNGLIRAQKVSVLNPKKREAAIQGRSRDSGQRRPPRVGSTTGALHPRDATSTDAQHPRAILWGRARVELL
eukprot:5943955-Pyramimonas_sp.AAC.1